ncbi:MAG: hypothetical protein LBU32_15710 [Clostridiales bacterium]|jgi:hypothetical protein|nr:hypothetical protein [Clostridiales bacterium]
MLSRECGVVYVELPNGQVSARPLVEPYEFGMLRMREALVFRRDMDFPFVTQLTPNFEMNLPKTASAPEFPTLRNIRVNVFEIDKFIEDRFGLEFAFDF